MADTVAFSERTLTVPKAYNPKVTIETTVHMKTHLDDDSLEYLAKGVYTRVFKVKHKKNRSDELNPDSWVLLRRLPLGDAWWYGESQR
mmetsp:Transcript_3050/g.6216  ORF Transcript_3050/g.6216 Transcript_3050/m.6216 type:complete len:88 (-) Transcript_3050:964-1227(-)